MYLLITLFIASACGTLYAPPPPPKSNAPSEFETMFTYPSVLEQMMYGTFSTFSVMPEFTDSKTKFEKEMEVDFSWAVGKFLAEIEESKRKNIVSAMKPNSPSKAHVIDLETFPIIQTDERDLKRVVLDNGMTVLIRSAHSIPHVAPQLWYNVGSKDEQPGEKGIAHLLDHENPPLSLNAQDRKELAALVEALHKTDTYTQIYEEELP